MPNQGDGGMAQPANLAQATTMALQNEIEAVIAKRPEWRFLEQQRHLSDVVRLLLRDAESHTDALRRSVDENTKALNQCWRGLIISQELQHPPRL